MHIATHETVSIMAVVFSDSIVKTECIDFSASSARTADLLLFGRLFSPTKGNRSDVSLYNVGT